MKIDNIGRKNIIMDAYEAELTSGKTKLCHVFIIRPTDNLICDVINYRRYKNFPAKQFVTNCLRNFRFIYLTCCKNNYCLSTIGLLLSCNYKRLLIKCTYSTNMAIYMLERMKIPTTVIDILKQFLKS